MEKSEEVNKELEKHKKIVLIKTLSDDLYNKLFSVLEQFFYDIKNKDIDNNVQISAFYNTSVRFADLIIDFCELMGIKEIEYISKDNVDKSHEIIKLENKYNKEK